MRSKEDDREGNDASTVGKASDDLLMFVEGIVDPSTIRVEEDLGAGFVRLRVTEAERRQAQHDIRWVEDALIELLRNARDAGASVIIVATSLEEERWRHLVVVDDGEGVPESHHLAIFEPRVTSRIDDVVLDRYGVHGRGMALFAVRSIAQTAKVAYSEQGRGASVRATFDLGRLPERKNQSERPRRSVDRGNAILTGTHNIPYTIAEFAIEHPEIDVFLGSPTEALATVVQRPASTVLIEEDAETYEGLSAVAERLGLDLSRRSLYRVLAGEIQALRPFVERLEREPRRSRARRAKRKWFTEEDWESLVKTIEESSSGLLGQYGLRIDEIRKLNVRDSLMIQILLEDEDDCH